MTANIASTHIEIKLIIMKSTFCLIACLPFILASCSAYQKVSLINFKEYNVPYDERGNLHYVLKKHRLHYSDTDSRNNIRGARIGSVSEKVTRRAASTVLLVKR